MSAIHEDKDRKVIPRWRSFLATSKLGELNPAHRLQGTDFVSSELLESKLASWRESRSAAAATEALACGLVTGHVDRVTEVAEFLLGFDEVVWTVAQVIAAKVVESEGSPDSIVEINEGHDEKQDHRVIRELKHRLHSSPKNSFLWTDLSLAYTNLGQSRKAERAMRAALAASAPTRFVLRAAARLYVHQDDLQRALDLFRRSEIVEKDPWLLSAEIAVASAAETGPKYLKRGRSVLANRNFPDSHLSELASALGTLELIGGNDKRARKLIRQSLVEPTENVVAQAGWTARRTSGIEIGESLLASVPLSYEARAWEAMRAGNWEATAIESKGWLADQPFSCRPASLGSYVNIVCAPNYPSAIFLAERGLVANPQDFTLRNNYVVAQALAGDIDRARKSWSSVDRAALSEEEKVVWLATTGLLLYRHGESEAGRVAYFEALQVADTAANEKRRVLAHLFFALEEVRGRAQGWKDIATAALKICEDNRHPDLVPMIRRLEKTIKE